MKGVLMKRTTLLFLLAAFLFAGSISLFAQLASDPNDRMYVDLKLWEDRGMLRNLPPLKPYPIQLLKKLLTEVQERGDKSDRTLAEQYYAELDGSLDFHAVGDTTARTNFNSSVYAQFTLEGTIQGSIDPLITYSGKLGVIVNNGPGNLYLPEYGRSMVDYVVDSTPPLGASKFIPRMSQASSAAFGSDTFYFQAGDIRGSFGPFWGDNTILSPSSPQSGQFSYVFRSDYFTVTETVMAISAVTSDGTGGLFPNKFVSLHSLEVYPLPWLTLGIFESIVFGPYFDPLYTLPFAVYFYAQGFGGYSENSFIGITGGIKFPASVRADFILYVDDAGPFNKLITLDFGNMMLEFSFQAGVSWTPNEPYLTRLSLNAIMVTPYTYTHTNDNGDKTGDPNYLDYTNAGQNIGPSIQPDSLRVEINALLRPETFLDLSPFARMILHGNAGAYYSGGTGTIFDNGFNQSPAPYSTFHFLDQSVIEKTFQAGFDSTVYIGGMQVSLTYTFEYMLDAGLIAGANAINNYLGMEVKYTY
jgi:hypothetical protein